MNKYTFTKIVKLIVVITVVVYISLVGYWLYQADRNNTIGSSSRVLVAVQPMSDLERAEQVCDESRLVTSGLLEEACGDALDAISADYQCTSYSPQAKCVAVRVIYTDIHPSTAYQANFNSVKVQ